MYNYKVLKTLTGLRIKPATAHIVHCKKIPKYYGQRD